MPILDLFLKRSLYYLFRLKSLKLMVIGIIEISRWKKKMQIAIKKYKFYITKTKFYGFIIKLKKLSIDLKKIKVIVN